MPTFEPFPVCVVKTQTPGQTKGNWNIYSRAHTFMKEVASKQCPTFYSQDPILQDAQRFHVIKTNTARGATSCVDIAIDGKTGGYVAIKRVVIRPNTHINIAKEAQIHKEISQHKHKHVMPLLDVIEGQYVVKFIMPYLSGGQLLDLIPPDTGLDPKIAARYAMQIFSALAHIHSLGYAHRDVKPENLLLTKDLKTVKLCDFGYAINATCNQKATKRGSVGTLQYLAPELFQFESETDLKNSDINWLQVDIWAAGIVVFSLFTGRFPWGAAHNNSKEYRLYAKGTHSDTETTIWKRIPEDLHVLLCQLLAVDPMARSSALKAYKTMMIINNNFNLNTM